MSKLLKTMQKTISLTIDGQQFTAVFPNVGQFLQIETLKQALSKGQYRELVTTNTVGTNQALNFIDAIAYLSVCVPDLKKRFAPNLSIESLSYEQGQLLVEAFTITYLPFYNKTLAAIDAAQADLVG